YPAPDLSTVEAVLGAEGVYLHAVWAFNVDATCEKESTDIIGEKGKISFSFFRPSDIEIVTSGGTEKVTLANPENIQLPMIDEVTKFFRGEGPNPCSLEDALITMRMMDSTRQNPT
ncbi:MAG TPA: hypothetical protein VIQ51_10595, partial [Chryseosolibacter sp.]